MPRPHCLAALLAIAGAAAGCGSGGDDDDTGGGQVLVLEHDFEALHLEAGEEVTSLCLSWRLDNTAPLLVNQVEIDAGPGWHHSNWFYVPEDYVSVTDGVWDCAGEIDEVSAGLAGGVLFAQSTQSTSETQTFADGLALEVPPHSLVVGTIHLINASESAIETPIRMEIVGLPPEAVSTVLQPMAFDFHQLAIPPGVRSRFETTCDLIEAYGGPIDLGIHYLLPHYHQLGVGMDVDIVGGPSDGESIFSGRETIGEPLGETMSPPVSLAGATGIRFACEFDNPTDRTVYFGNSGGAEMCMLLAYSDSAAVFAGGVLSGSPEFRGEEDGVRVYQGDCQAYSVLR